MGDWLEVAARGLSEGQSRRGSIDASGLGSDGAAAVGQKRRASSMADTLAW